MPNISLVGHNHTCPMYAGKKPHVGGPVSSGQSACTVNGVPVAVVGDSCTCKRGGPDKIVSGHSAVTINGKPVSIVGSATAHGGVVVQGDASFTVS